MGTQDDRDALLTRWRLMFMGGRVSDVLAEVNVRLAETDQQVRPFLLRWQASAYNHLGHYAAAMESARTALEINAAHDDLNTTALIYAAIGTAYTGMGRHDEAVANFEIAEHLLRELGDEWALSSVLINLAVCELSRRSNDTAIGLLDDASACKPVSETDLKEEPYRTAVIRINRSSAFFQSARTGESIDELLRAREEIAQVGNLMLLGTVEYNLAKTYQRLHLYSSMLEAADSAAQKYGHAGNVLGVRKARAVAAAALANLGKRQQAYDLATKLLSAARDEEIEEVRFELEDVAKEFRYNGWGKIPGLSARRHGQVSDRVSAILDRLSELMDQNYAGDGYSESEELLAELE